MSSFLTHFQALNQLGTAGGAESFLRGAQFFELCPIVLNNVQHIFSRGEKNFLGGAYPHWLRACSLPVSSRISDFCEISDLLLFVSYSRVYFKVL